MVKLGSVTSSMSSQYNKADDFDEYFTKFHESQVVGARRQLHHSHDSIREKFNSFASLISILLVVATVAYRFYGRPGHHSSPGKTIWDLVIYILPARLIFALDHWQNAEARNQMSPSALSVAKSEAMQRILGLDRPGGMMASVFRARQRALSVSGGVLGLNLLSDRPAGLGNHDNSCYQNSILQGLSALDSFPDYLAACVRNFDSKNRDREVAQTLRTLISDLNDVSNNGRTLWTPTLLKSMSTWTQQDAQEYFSKILDDIDKGVSNAIREARPTTGLEGEQSTEESISSKDSDDSGYQSASSNPKLSDMKLLRNPLEGLLAQRVACVRCGHFDGLSLIPFNCLTLSLGLDKNQHDVYDRLDAFTNVETIDGVECSKCTLLKAKAFLGSLLQRMRDAKTSEEQLLEPSRRLEAINLALEEDDFEEETLRDSCKISSKSKVSSTKTKQIVVARPPQSLIIHVNRSVFDPSTYDMVKNSAPVRFPLTLDLGPWCLGSSGLDDKKRDQNWEKVPEEENWQTNPMESMIAGDLGPSRLTGPIYELRAAVTHYGRHENGHYVCYRKYPQSSVGKEIVSDDEKAASHLDTSSIDDDLQGSSHDNAKPKEQQRENTWWRLSDHNVSKVDDETVLGLSPGVFMLFYECVDASMVVDPDYEDAYANEALNRDLLGGDASNISRTASAVTSNNTCDEKESVESSTVTSVENESYEGGADFRPSMVTSTESG